MTVLLVLGMCGIFLGIDTLYGKRLTRRARRAVVDRGPGITWVPQLGWCAQDGGTLIDPAGPETRAAERDQAVWAKQQTAAKRQARIECVRDGSRQHTRKH